MKRGVTYSRSTTGTGMPHRNAFRHARPGRAFNAVLWSKFPFRSGQQPKPQIWFWFSSDFSVFQTHPLCARLPCESSQLHQGCPTVTTRTGYKRADTRHPYARAKEKACRRACFGRLLSHLQPLANGYVRRSGVHRAGYTVQLGGCNKPKRGVPLSHFR
jgi:hypothetical protein